MMTSSPILPSNASRRVSFSLQRCPQLTPLNRNRQNAALELLDESNDDIERAERRRSVALRKSILALPSAAAASPALNDSLRGLSDEDLKSQLQVFCKLYAENKISVKNAWNLRIIDVLKHIVSKDNPDVLKVAGNSLEIAGKVYGLRVDDLYAEGLKLAGSLARDLASKGQEDEENEDNDDPHNSENQVQKKKKDKQAKRQKNDKQAKKKRVLLPGDKTHTISSDRKGFLCKLPKLDSAAFSVRTDTSLSATSNLFTNKVQMDPAGYKFMFASKENAWPWQPKNDPSVDMETNKKFPIVANVMKSSKLCAPFKDFRVDMWDPDLENPELLKKANPLEDMVLDDNGIPIAELDGPMIDVFQERDNEDLNGVDDANGEELIESLIRQDMEHVVDFTPTEQRLAKSMEKSAYSYNIIINTGVRKIDQIWGGPNHWKLKFIRGSQMVYSGEDRNEQKEQQGKIKKKVINKRNEHVWVNLRNLRPPKDYTKIENKPIKKKISRKNCLLSPDEVTLPILDSSCTKFIDEIEYLMTVPTMKPEKNKTQEEMDYQVSEYNYNNPNDSNYCPEQQPMKIDDNGTDLGDDLFDNGDNIRGTPIVQEYEASGFIGNNLVDAPQMVQQTHMNYATRAKKMDMKKLKQVVWCVLTRTEKFDPTNKVVPTTFSEMYKELPKLLPEKMNAELSCSMAFVALLHLCNEQNLELKKMSDNSDFGIAGPEC